MLITKNPDDLTQQEKIMLGIESIRSFFDSIDPGGENDIYKQIVLEELFKFLLSEKDSK
jgi:hypothetical protein